ncbi:MAG: AAA family ATPase [Candidatus Doudnabacteria bacterium]|nr:AAA family ATPase [Candidatus Doudnabacteria bacterium]
MIFIAIAGPSGAGKTTLASFLTANFRDEFEHIRQDDYLRHPDEFPMKGKYKNWEHPHNYKFEVLYEHLKKLKQGEKVLSRTFAPDETVEPHEFYLEPKQYILVDGSLILTNEDVASMFDKKFYMDIPPELMIERRRTRSNHFGIDTEEYDREVTIPEFERHGMVQKLQADHIVDGTRDPKTIAHEVRELILKPK